MELSEQGALLADTYGQRLLGYLCAAEPDQLAERLGAEVVLTDRQEEVISALLGLARRAAEETARTNVPVGMYLDWLGESNPATGTSNGNALRIHAGGEVTVSEPNDPVASPLARMLLDVYPLMLVPPDPRWPVTGQWARPLWNSPHRTSFEAAVLADPDLSRLFTRDTPNAGRTGNVYRSTGFGGSVQLWSLHNLLLSNAWSRGHTVGRDDIAALATELAASVELIRKAVRGEPCTVATLLAFTGVVLEGVERVILPFGVLRPVADGERALAPPHLNSGLTHTNADGETVTVSYAGDLVLDSAIEYRLKVMPNSDHAMGANWPVDLRASEELEEHADTLRLAGQLANPDAPFTLARTWRVIFDPISTGPAPSWSDPRGTPLAPRRMTGRDVVAFSSLVSAIHAN